MIFLSLHCLLRGQYYREQTHLVLSNGFRKCKIYKKVPVNADGLAMIQFTRVWYIICLMVIQIGSQIDPKNSTLGLQCILYAIKQQLFLFSLNN